MPIIVAVNKIDKPGAQPDRIRQQLSGHGLTPEEWGGDTIHCDVSARNRTGVDRLLEMLARSRKSWSLKANPNKPAKGTVVEARMDAKRGPVSTLLVEEGTLRIGDNVVVGEELGKVRAMMDDKGRQIQQAGPATPVEVLGLSGVPRAGEVMNSVNDERSARIWSSTAAIAASKGTRQGGSGLAGQADGRDEGGPGDLKVIPRPTQGSVEALGSALSKLFTDKVRSRSSKQPSVVSPKPTSTWPRQATPSSSASTSARLARSLRSPSKRVSISLYDIIYDAIDEVKQAMAGLQPRQARQDLGKAEVREIFNIPKIGSVLGCFVSEGSIKRSTQARVIRDSVLIYTGKLGSLRRFGRRPRSPARLRVRA